MADYTEKKNLNLLSAIDELKKTQNEETLNLFLDELAHNAEFYAPMRTVGNGKDARPAFAIISDKEKHQYYAFFTSKEKAHLWSQRKEKYALLSFQKIAGMSIGDPRIAGFVINPASDNFIVGRKLISDAARLLHAESFDQEAEEIKAPVEFQEPDGNYEEMLDALKEYMRGDSNISAAYLLQAEINGQTSYVIIVNHIHKMQPSFGNIGLIAKDFGNGRPVALLSARAKEAGEAIKDIMPFYVRPFVVK